MKMNKKIILKLFYNMFLIRHLEETLLELFSKGKLFGTTHTYIGQEAIATAVCFNLSKDDKIFSPHRCHAHFISYGGDPKQLICELMGKESGVCAGRGGSQHLHWKNFYSNGIQGGIVGNATGAALAEKLNNTQNIVVVFLGDGTLGQGLVYESLNFASLQSLPVLFVLENNQYAQSTHIGLAVSGSIIKRAQAFNVTADETSENDVVKLYELFRKRIDFIRNEKRPFFQIVHTYRFSPHSKGDDYRDPKEIEMHRANDPLFKANDYLEEEQINSIREEVKRIIQDAVKDSEKKAFSFFHEDPSIEKQILADVCKKKFLPPLPKKNETYVQSLNRALHQLFGKNKDIFLIGEDILDPYGGAFKVSKGLSTRFPKRVIPTPISEAGIVAWSTGAALMGMRPIAEIMFGDFLSLAADQIINHTSKYRWMYNNQVNVRLLIRTPMGGRRGYGPTHSQTLEKVFMGIPGLIIVAPSHLLDPGEILKRCILNTRDPILFIENKSLYAEPLVAFNNNRFGSFTVHASGSLYPTLSLSLTNFDSQDGVLICYGGNVPIAMEVVQKLLLEHEIALDIIVPALISPVPISEIRSFIKSAKHIITLEEGTKRAGWGAEVLSEISESNSLDQLKLIRIGAQDCPIPASKALEQTILPNTDSVIDIILRRIQ